MSEEYNFDQFSKALDVPRHVIHLWTKKFPVLSPQRTAAGKVGFNHKDLLLAQGLKYLLIAQKNSIKDVQAMLNERGIPSIIDIGKQHSTSNKPSETKTLSLPQTSQNSSKRFHLNHKEIAKQTFNNLSNIFSRDNNKQEIAFSEENIPDPLSPSNTPIEEPDNFEEKWRHHMEKTGKATPVEEAREKSVLIDNTLLSDIWEVDDEIELFNNEPEAFTPQIDNQSSTSSPSFVKPYKKSPSVKNTQPKDMNISSLSIEQTEKIRHLIAKLDIMHEELQTASSTITSVLKAFGYSGFENAFNKFDQKAAY